MRYVISTRSQLEVEGEFASVNIISPDAELGYPREKTLITILMTGDRLNPDSEISDLSCFPILTIIRDCVLLNTEQNNFSFVCLNWTRNECAKRPDLMKAGTDAVLEPGDVWLSKYSTIQTAVVYCSGRFVHFCWIIVLIAEWRCTEAELIWYI